MTKKQEFLKALKNNSWYGLSLLESVQRLNQLFDMWQGMRKNAQKATEAALKGAISDWGIYILRMSVTERVLGFEDLKKDMPESDLFFRKINKEFPEEVILETLYDCGYRM